MSPEFPKSRRAPGLFWLVVILYVVASSARAEEESYGFLSFEECCTDIGFRVDETILMNTQGSLTPVHFFSAGFGPYLMPAIAFSGFKGRFGVEGTAMYHISDGVLNWEMESLGVSLPPMVASVGDLVLAANIAYRIPVGAITIVGFGGVALSATSLKVWGSDYSWSEMAEVGRVTADCGAKALVSLGGSLYIGVGCRGYLPAQVKFELEPGLTLRSAYRPLEAAVVIGWGSPRMGL